MSTKVTPGRIIVKPRDSRGWMMITGRAHWEMYFHSRQRAIQFARAYARLNRPSTLEVVGGSGDLEVEESFGDSLA